MRSPSQARSPSGCSAGSNGASDGGTKSIGTPDGKGKTITVWIMNGDLSPKILDVAEKQFTKDTGAKVKLQLQQWDGITTKLTTALAQQDARTWSTSATHRCRCTPRPVA